MITTLDQLARCEWVIIHGKPYNRGWIQSWQLRMAKMYVDNGQAYEGIRLTNGQYYPNITNEQIFERFYDDLKQYRPCDDCMISNKCNEPNCWKAIMAWKGAEIK